MPEILAREIECKDIDTNHLQKWMSADFSSPNVDAISSSQKEFASRVEAEQYTSYTDGKHATIANTHLRSAVVIINMDNNIRPIS